MYFDERGTYYVMGEEKWFCLYLTLENVKEALTEAGTTIIMVKRDPGSIEEIQNPVQYDCKAAVFIVAQKVEF